MKKAQYKTKQDLMSAISENRDMIKSFGVNGLGIFGSFSKGTAVETSDVDLLVDFIPKKRALITLWICHSFWKACLVERLN